VKEYQELKEDIDKLVGHINGKFSTPSWYLISRKLNLNKITSKYFLLKGPPFVTFLAQ